MAAVCYPQRTGREERESPQPFPFSRIFASGCNNCPSRCLVQSLVLLFSLVPVCVLHEGCRAERGRDSDVSLPFSPSRLLSTDHPFPPFPFSVAGQQQWQSDGRQSQLKYQLPLEMRKNMLFTDKNRECTLSLSLSFCPRLLPASQANGPVLTIE